MLLIDTISMAKECVFGVDGIITNLNNGKTEKPEDKMSDLRILFRLANHSLQTNLFVTAEDMAPFAKIIEAFEQHSSSWAQEFAKELKDILYSKQKWWCW